MSKRKRAVWAGGILILLVVIAAVVHWVSLVPSFSLPNGREVRLEAATWRPDNRVARTPLAPVKSRLGGLLSRLGFPGFFPNNYHDIGAHFPGVVWLSVEDTADVRGLEIRLAQGPVEGRPLMMVSPGSTAAGRILFAYFMETVPQDAGPLSARIYHRESSTAPARLLGEVPLKPVVAPLPNWGTNFLLTASGTNDLLRVSLLDWQIPAVPAPTHALDPSVFWLRIEETATPGLVSTNWEVASVQMWNQSGDMMFQHVDNRGFTNGILAMGLRSVWRDGQPWKLRVGLARKWNFPETNHVRFASVPTPTPYAPNNGVTVHAAGNVFTARVELGRMPDPVPEATNWLASVLVTVNGHHGGPPHHVRWVRFTDQRGTNHTFSRGGWGGDKFRFGLSRERDFIEAEAISGDLVISWEPILHVDLVAAPRAVTNFTDWPTRKPPPGKTPAQPEAPTEVSRP